MGKKMDESGMPTGEMVAGTLRMVTAVLINGKLFPRDMHVAFFVGLVAGYLLLPSLFFASSAKEKLMRAEVFKSNVLITGASQGIGEELAYSFARRGANLIITARSNALLQNVSANCIHLGARSVKIISADMSSPEDIESLHEFVRMKFGTRLNYLVLNHAKQARAANWMGAQENITLLRDIMDVNYFAYVQLASLFLEQVERNSGRIVVVSSFVGKYSFPFYAPYVSSKFALQGFFGSLRQELKMRNSPTSVTLAVLGRIDTPGQRNAMKTGGFVRHGSVPAAASPEKTAEAILEGAVYREKEVHYPLVRPLVMAANMPFLSDLLDWFVGYQMERHPNA